MEFFQEVERELNKVPIKLQSVIYTITLFVHVSIMYQYSYVNLLVLMSHLIFSYSNLTDPHKGHTSLPYCHAIIPASKILVK